MASIGIVDGFGAVIGLRVVLIRCAIVFAATLSSPLPSYAQLANPLTTPRVTLQAPGSNGAQMVHRNAIGKPCLSYEAVSRSQIASPSVFDNIISINNQCARRIVVQLCYLGSTSCIDIEVPGFKRKDAVLGVRSQSQYFRYSFKEKF